MRSIALVLAVAAGLALLAPRTFAAEASIALFGAVADDAMEANIGFGEMVSGALAEAGLTGARGNYIARYQFSGAPGDEVEIRLMSDAFDTYLEFLSPRMELLAADDDGAGNFDSLIRYVLPSAGPFYIDATSYAGGVTGAFTLSLSRAGDAPDALAASTPQAVPETAPQAAPLSVPAPAPVPGALGVPIAYGQSFAGRLEAGDSVLEDGTHYDDYVFQGSAGDAVRVAMNSEELDTYLYLLDGATGEEMAVDDDGGGGWNALLTLTLPRSGAFIFRANSVSAGETGGYTVSLLLVGGAPPPPEPEPVAAPAPAAAPTTLDPGLSQFFFGTPVAPTGMIADGIDFGDDSSIWANDGECDDPRFEGPGIATMLEDGNSGRDATDCLAMYRAGQVRLR